MGRFEGAKETIEEIQHGAARAGRKVQETAQEAGRKVLHAAETLKDDARRRLHHAAPHDENDSDEPEQHGRLASKARAKARGVKATAHGAKAKAREAMEEGKDQLIRATRKPRPYEHAPQVTAYLVLTAIVTMIIALLMRGGDVTGSTAGTYPKGMEHHFPHDLHHDKPMGVFEQMARKIFHKPPQPPTAFEKAQHAATGAVEDAAELGGHVLSKAKDVVGDVLEKSVEMAGGAAQWAGEKSAELASDALDAATARAKEAGHKVHDTAVKLGKHAL